MSVLLKSKYEVCLKYNRTFFYAAKKRPRDVQLSTLHLSISRDAFELSISHLVPVLLLLDCKAFVAIIIAMCDLCNVKFYIKLKKTS